MGTQVSHHFNHNLRIDVLSAKGNLVSLRIAENLHSSDSAYVVLSDVDAEKIQGACEAFNRVMAGELEAAQ